MEDVDEDSKEFNDGYDENLMGDDEDKRKLAQMTEKEREQELYNRSERRETLKIRFEIERKLKNKAKKREAEKKQGKQVRARKRLRASEIYSSEESSEDSDEYIPDKDNTSTLNDAATGGKASKMSTRASSALLSSSSSPSSASSSVSSSSTSSDSEPEHDESGADEDSQLIQDDFEMTLADLKALQLKRDRIEQMIYSRYFRETAIGLFVKISVSSDEITGVHTYKVAYVVDITKGKTTYSLSLGKTYKTDKQCLVRIGGVERTYRLSFISNRSFDEEDFIKWRETMNATGHSMPSREHFSRKRSDLNKAINHSYDDEDIAFEIQERARFKESHCNFALKKTELMGEKAEAENQNNFEKARELQRQIDELEEQAKRLEKSRSSSTFSAISFVNERNRIKNIEESERVLKESKSVKTEDPFTRRKCTPRIVHNRNNNANSGDTNGANDKNNPKSATANSTTISTTTNGTPKVVSENVKSVNDLFQAHANIDIDLDIDI